MSTSPQHIGKYELRERLRYSSIDEVWKALDTQSQRYILIELFHPDQQITPKFITRFEQEVQNIASLHHPNIAQVHDFHISHPPEPISTFAYMVTDYIEGQTLADYIHSTSRVGKFPPAGEILRLFASLSIAIDYAHQHGVTHRHIKPASILLDKRHSAPDFPGEPILTEFGISNLPGAPGNLQLDTALYLAPEQAQGYAGNELSDIYSLGVILYEISTGVPPFQGDTPNAIMMQHINTIPTSPVLVNPNIPPALAAVILRSLAKEPGLRFSSASSMTRALAEAFNLPIPENLIPPGHLTDGMSEPTYYKPRRPNLSSDFTPSSPPVQIIRSSTPPPKTLSTQSQQPTVAPVSSTQNTFTTLTSGPSSATPTSPSLNQPTVSSSMSTLSLPLTPPVPTPPPSAKKRRRALTIALIALLLLVSLGSGLGKLFLLPQGSTIKANPVVGHAFFISSGKLNKDNSQSINDELLIELHNVPGPAHGKSYYAWLLTDDNQLPRTLILLGTAPVHRGEVNQVYHSPHSINLLAITSRLLITEEDAYTTPTHPSTDLRAWRYYAELPQKPDPTDTMHHFSILTHLRYLLSKDPTLTSEGLPGGLVIWFTKNTGKILEWAGSARDNWTAKSPILLRNQLISILEYLDGSSLVQADLPPGTPLLVDTRFASIPLLGISTQDQTALSYPRQITAHLNAIARSPAADPDKRELINEIDVAINHLASWLKRVHDDAEQLIKLNNAQLLLPSSQVILDEMQTLAFYAYAGQFDPATNKLQAGVIQIHYDIERLATFDITPYTSK